MKSTTTKTALFAAALSAMLAFGCDDKKNDAASPEMNKAADKTASEAASKMNDVKSDVKDATSAAKDQADKSADAMKNQADQNAAAMKAGAENNQSSIDDLISKAKDAIKDKKWSDADNYVKQIDDIKSKLPADQQAKIDAGLADVKKMIQAGKTMTPGM